MIALSNYRSYWEGVAQRIEAITATMGVTVDEDMGPRLQNIPAGTATLFWSVPSAQDNICVIFVMVKYDRQRQRATDVLEQVQPIIEQLKQTIIDDMAEGCQVLAGLDVTTLSTIPETGFYGDFAGWSLGFTLNTEVY